MKIAAFFLAPLLWTATPALAQLDGPPLMEKGAQVDYRFAGIAVCLVNGAQAKAARFLEVEPGQMAHIEALKNLIRAAPFCTMPASMTRAPMITWRGAVAEALYTKRSAANLALSARPAWIDMPGYAAYDIARCAAETNPVAADRVVRAARGSAEERAAVADLLPALRGCGKGRKADFDRVTIHGMVAEGLLRTRAGMIAAAGNN